MRNDFLFHEKKKKDEEQKVIFSVLKLSAMGGEKIERQIKRRKKQQKLNKHKILMNILCVLFHSQKFHFEHCARNSAICVFFSMFLNYFNSSFCAKLFAYKWNI